ncbi:MAG: hypothetical protein EOP89_05850, partial [Lysobacteraceae bacterium]
MSKLMDMTDITDAPCSAPSDDSAIASPFPAPLALGVPTTNETPPAPIGGTPQLVKTWFDGAATAARPEPDGTLA